MKQNVKQSLDDYDTLGFIEMDETDGIERLIFFEQYLKKLRHEREDFFKETLERVLSTTLELPFVEDCRKLYIKKKKLKKTGKVFGAPLNNYQLARIQPLINTIRNEIYMEGIFRKPGSRLRQKELRELLDEGKNIPRFINVNDACDLLKAFLRELTSSLLPEEHFDTHIAIADMCTNDGCVNKRRRIATLQALYLCLPDVNRMALRMILQLLHSVARMQDENKMTASSLATVFLPALLPQVIEHGSNQAREKLSAHLTFLIRHARKILMPPIEIVTLVQKFYPDCLKNMPPPPKAPGVFKRYKQKRTVDRLKDGLINLISPAKNRRPKTPTRAAGSISHTLLFRSGSADWTSSPKILDNQCRSKSEKTLNRQSTLMDSDDLPHYRTPLNSEYQQYKKLQGSDSGSMGSISSLLSSAPSNDVFDQAKSADQMSQFSLDAPELPKSFDCDNNIGNQCESFQKLAEACSSSKFARPETKTPEDVADVLCIRKHQSESLQFEEDKISAKLDLALDSLEGRSSDADESPPTTKISMRECLDESTFEPQFKITSIADLIRIRQEEKREQEKENNRISYYDNIGRQTSSTDMRRQTSSKDVRRQTSLKRDSPTPPCNAKKQKVMEEQTKEPTIRPIIRPRNTNVSHRRDGLRRNSSTKMGPLGRMSIRKEHKETII